MRTGIRKRSTGSSTERGARAPHTVSRARPRVRAARAIRRNARAPRAT